MNRFLRAAPAAAPVGALALLVSAQVPWQVMMVLAGWMETSETAVVAREVLLLQSGAGLIGSVLLSLGLIMACLARRRAPALPSASRACWIVATFGFALAVLVNGWGIQQLKDAFRRLALAESVDPESLRANIASAPAALLSGQALVLVAAIAVFAAVWWSLQPFRQDGANPSPSSRGAAALVVATIAALIFCGGLLWANLALASLPYPGTESPPPPPHVLAEKVLAIFTGTRASLLGLAGFGLASLLCSFQTRERGE